jgi:plastocyanin
MLHKFRRLRFALPLTALVLTVAGAATAGIAMHMASAGPTKVTVIETEFHLALSTHAFRGGKYTFIAVNKGKIGHSLEITGPGIKPTQLGHLLNPGQSGSLSLTLRPGRYDVFCPVPGHRAAGQEAKIVVKATTAVAATSTPAPKSNGGGSSSWG